MKTTKENVAAAFKLVLGFDGEIRAQAPRKELSHQIGQIVSFLIPNLMIDPIPAIIHARHENRKNYRYDIIIHYPTNDGWVETRLYNVDEAFLDSNIVIKEDEKEMKQPEERISKELQDVSEPLMKYLSVNHNPHTIAIITSTSIEVYSGEKSIQGITQYLKD